MASMETAPTDWTISYAGCATDDAGDPTCFESTEDRTLAEKMAVEFLWQWTYRAYGTTEITLRPCQKDCPGASTFEGGGMPRSSGVAWQPVIIGGQWYNVACGSCGDYYHCGCSRVSSLKLPGPIDSIVTVTIDGQVRAPATYRVDNYKYLVSEGDPWPTCQDMALPDTENDTWSVTYQIGVAVPVGGQVAAGILACEFGKALCKDKSCQLPQRIQSISREGVTVAMLDSFDDIDSGHTGIWTIDSWVASVTKPHLPSTVLSPDYQQPRHVRTTWRTGVTP